MFNGEYSNSVRIGTDELVRHLNRRHLPGPVGMGCTHETVILAGYSQGADVLGWALERIGNEGSWSLTPEAKAHIGFTAFFGDPKFDSSCPAPWWVRGTTRCDTIGALGPRVPYIRSDFAHRLGSWCDSGDGICNFRTPLPGNHTSVYRDWWIWQSAAEIAHTARVKICQFRACVSNQVIIAGDSSIFAKSGIGYGGWAQEVGPGNANRIAAGGANQLFIRGDAAVFGRTGIGSTWTQEVGPGNANAIAVSSTGVQMFIRGDAAIFAKQGGNWVMEVGPGNANAIAVGGNTQMFIRGDAAVFAKETVGEGGWVMEVGPGNATKIAVSRTGIQMFLRGDAAVFAKRSIGYGGWIQEVGPGNATAIAVGGETQMFLRGDGAVFAKNWVGDGGWVMETDPGTAIAIAVCEDGTQMILRHDRAVFAKRGVGYGGWILEASAGTANAIACG